MGWNSRAPKITDNDPDAWGKSLIELQSFQGWGLDESCENLFRLGCRVKKCSNFPGLEMPVWQAWWHPGVTSCSYIHHSVLRMAATWDPRGSPAAQGQVWEGQGECCSTRYIPPLNLPTSVSPIMAVGCVIPASRGWSCTQLLMNLIGPTCRQGQAYFLSVGPKFKKEIIKAMQKQRSCTCAQKQTQQWIQII